MKSGFSNIDSIIFDMDGTLWNATESYAKVWNKTCEHFGIEASFTGSDLVRYMGMSIKSIMEHLLGGEIHVEKAVFLEKLGETEALMMPTLGGILYPETLESLERLHETHRLFMLSNCSSIGLRNFVNYTHTAHLFEGLLTQGERPVSKSENLRYMMEHYSLRAPVYVGDTQDDCDQAHEAGIAFIHAGWGFGDCHDADGRFDSMQSFVQAMI